MATKNLISAQQYLDKKIEWILNTFLGGLIDDFNTDNGYTGDKAIRKPKEFYVNVDGLDLGALSANPYDLKNTIIVRNNSSSSTEDNLINDRDIKATLEVIALYVSDYGKIDWVAKQARYLAIMAEQVLEQFLPDQAHDPDGCVVYNTRLISNTGATRIPLQDQDFHLVACSSQIEVSMRANILFQPTLINPTLPQLPWFASSFVQPVIDLETDLAVVIGSADPATSNTLTITAADLGAATSIILNEPTFPDNSTVFAMNQNQGITTTATFIGGTATLPLAACPINNNDLWTLTIVNSQTNTPSAYQITWNVV